MTSRASTRVLIGLVATLGLVVGSTSNPATAAPAAPAVVVTSAASAGPSVVVSGVALGGVATVNTLTERLLEAAVLTLTNVKRIASGCRPLRLNYRLRRAARLHSVRMGRHNTMSHQLPGEPWLGRRLRIENYYWRRAAENIAWGYPTARSVVRAWWNSTAHRRNIKDCRLRELGVGVHIANGRVWWTQNFGRR